MTAITDARLILTPVCYRGQNAHNDQWRLDRARWLWQHGGRSLRSAARAELDDMNALRRHYAWEGKPGYDGAIPLAALREPVGDLTRLGTRP
jgi:hypothetical protein